MGIKLLPHLAGIVFVATLCVNATLTAADDARFYFAADPGIKYLPSANVLSDRIGILELITTTRIGRGVIDTVSAPARPLSASFDLGPSLDLAFGYKITDQWQFELNSGISRNWISSLSYPDIANGGTIKAGAGETLYQFPVMANAIYRFKPVLRLRPYLGAGAGGVVGLINGQLGSDACLTFGFQAMTGVRYQIWRNCDLGLGYKFGGTLDQRFSRVDLTLIKPISHTLFLSADFSF